MKNVKNELREQNEMADALIAKLEKIKAIWAELPTVDDLEEIGKAAGSVAASLERAKEAYNGDDFPTTDDFDDLDKRLGGIVGSLNEIIEKQEEVEQSC